MQKKPFEDPVVLFASPPDLNEVCSVTVRIESKTIPGGSITTQPKILKCRELIFTEPDIIAAPSNDQFDCFTVVMTQSLYKTGRLQTRMRKNGLQPEKPMRVSPGVYQSCLRYTLLARLAPSWNKAGDWLIQGRDFLSHTGCANAVKCEVIVHMDQLYMSVCASVLRLSPLQLADLNLSQLQMNSLLYNAEHGNGDLAMHGEWCHVVPSLKKARLCSISLSLPDSSPFTSYREIKRHWKNTYGFRLPETDDDIFYAQISFWGMHGKQFTYPSICLRSGPLQHVPRVDQKPIMTSFLQDLHSKMPSVCGHAMRFQPQLRYPRPGVCPASQDMHGPGINLSKRSSISSSQQFLRDPRDLVMTSSASQSETSHLRSLKASAAQLKDREAQRAEAVGPPLSQPLSQSQVSVSQSQASFRDGQNRAPMTGNRFVPSSQPLSQSQASFPQSQTPFKLPRNDRSLTQRTGSSGLCPPHQPQAPAQSQAPFRHAVDSQTMATISQRMASELEILSQPLSQSQATFTQSQNPSKPPRDEQRAPRSENMEYGKAPFSQHVSQFQASDVTSARDEPQTPQSQRPGVVDARWSQVSRRSPASLLGGHCAPGVVGATTSSQSQDQWFDSCRADGASVTSTSSRDDIVMTPKSTPRKSILSLHKAGREGTTPIRQTLPQSVVQSPATTRSPHNLQLSEAQRQTVTAAEPPLASQQKTQASQFSTMASFQTSEKSLEGTVRKSLGIQRTAPGLQSMTNSAAAAGKFVPVFKPKAPSGTNKMAKSASGPGVGGLSRGTDEGTNRIVPVFKAKLKPATSAVPKTAAASVPKSRSLPATSKDSLVSCSQVTSTSDLGDVSNLTSTSTLNPNPKPSKPCFVTGHEPKPSAVKLVKSSSKASGGGSPSVKTLDSSQSPVTLAGKLKKKMDPIKPGTPQAQATGLSFTMRPGAGPGASPLTLLPPPLLTPRSGLSATPSSTPGATLTLTSGGTPTPGDQKKRKGEGRGDEGAEKKARSKPQIQDVDVESLARADQLAKVNTVTLINWLKERGVHCKAKVKKGDLVDRVKVFLAIINSEA